MFTAFVLIVIAGMWWRAHRRFGLSPDYPARRSLSGWAWAFLGAAAGSFGGIAAFGTAIAGTLPGALVGYFLAGYLLMKQQIAETAASPRQETAGNSAQSAVPLPSIAGFVLAGIRWVLGLGLLGICVIVGLILINEATKTSANVAPQVADAVQAPPQSSTVLPVKLTAYDLALRDLEGRNPRINPNSSDFDAQAADAVDARRFKLQANGATPEAALRQAVKEVLSRKNTARRAGPPVDRGAFQEDRRPLCQYKDVMSDSDYKACGLRPPGVH